MSTSGTASYVLENSSFQILKDSLDKLQDFSKEEKFIQYSKGKPFQDIVIINQKTPTRMINRNVEYYNQESDQWLREGNYISWIQYVNKNFSGKTIEEAWIKRAIVAVFIFILIISIGFILIPKKNYVAPKIDADAGKIPYVDRMLSANKQVILGINEENKWYYVRGSGNYANKPMTIKLFYLFKYGEKSFENKNCVTIGILENGNILGTTSKCEGETLNSDFGEYLADTLLIKEVHMDDLNFLNSYALIEALAPK